MTLKEPEEMSGAVYQALNKLLMAVAQSATGGELLMPSFCIAGKSRPG